MLAKRILVPIDFSPCSKAALTLAVDLANGMAETSVIVLHVAEPIVPSYDEELVGLEGEVWRTEVETVAASREHDVQIDAIDRYGAPADKIL